MNEELALPTFLDRKINPVSYTEEEQRIIKRTHSKVQKLIWPKKRNWRKIEERRRKADRQDFGGYTFTQKRGQ